MRTARAASAVLLSAIVVMAAPASAVGQSAGPAISANDPAAQAELASRYRRGEGVTQDFAEARRLYELAAAQKSGPALRELGEMNMAGEGARRDDRKAVQQWKDAAFAGDRRAPVLVADYLFTKVTGVAPPASSATKLTIKRSMPLDKVVEAGRWYQVAIERDDRPEIRERAHAASALLQVVMKVAGYVEDRRR